MGEALQAEGPVWAKQEEWVGLGAGVQRAEVEGPGPGRDHGKGLGFHLGTVRAIRGLTETLFVKHAVLSLESSQPLVCRNCSTVTRLQLLLPYILWGLVNGNNWNPTLPLSENGGKGSNDSGNAL